MSKLPKISTARNISEIELQGETRPEKLLQSTIVRRTTRGLRVYNLLCLAMKDVETDEVCVVRKAHFADSHDITDWFVAHFKEGQDSYTEDHVVAVRVDEDDSGDEIHLDLAPYVSHQGPSTLSFVVDDMYRPTGEPAQKTHKMYYGRGVDPRLSNFVDIEYTLDVSQLTDPATKYIFTIAS